MPGFWPLEEKLIYHSKRDKATGCWLWRKSRFANGYGKTSVWPEKPCTYAHRVSYETFREKIPEGFVLDHLCRVKHCINPWHLEVVTQSENILRGNPTWPVTAIRRKENRATGEIHTK